MPQSETAHPASAICGNCGAATSGAYCSACGQQTKLEPPTVAEFFSELIDHFIHFDGKLWCTLVPLFLQPGKLPRDYVENRRACYVKPLKLYLAAIALAFAAVQFLGWDLSLRFGAGGAQLRFDMLQRAPPSTTITTSRLRVDSVPWVLEHVETKGIRKLRALAPEKQLKIARDRGIHYLPYLTLALVPVYSALLQWVYRTRRRRYGVHLVFGLYTHSFLLLIFIIEAKLPMALASLLSAWAVVYYVIALKRMYGGTWGETIGRGSLLAILYFLTSLAIGFLATVVLLSL